MVTGVSLRFPPWLQTCFHGYRQASMVTDVSMVNGCVSTATDMLSYLMPNKSSQRVAWKVSKGFYRV